MAKVNRMDEFIHLYGVLILDLYTVSVYNVRDKRAPVINRKDNVTAQTGRKEYPMSTYTGKHPVFLSHTKELEKMLYFTADLQQRLQRKGKASGEKYDCLVRVRRKCADLLMKLYAEEDPTIILMNDLDASWIRLIVGFVHKVILKDEEKAG